MKMPNKHSAPSGKRPTLRMQSGGESAFDNVAFQNSLKYNEAQQNKQLRPAYEYNPTEPGGKGTLWAQNAANPPAANPITSSYNTQTMGGMSDFLNRVPDASPDRFAAGDAYAANNPNVFRRSGQPAQPDFMRVNRLRSTVPQPFTEKTESDGVTLLPPYPYQMQDGGELRMQSGGMFDGIKKTFGLNDSPELAAYKARIAAEREAAKNPPPKPAAPAPAPTAPMGNQTIIDNRLKAAGAKDGGEIDMTRQMMHHTGLGGPVPGKGTGDKTKALYEKGEFVVSNDMLRADPGLREELHALREQVLAQKGMTPEEADAKAVGGKTLRANDGFDPAEWLRRNFPNGASDLDMPKGATPPPASTQAPKLRNALVPVPGTGDNGYRPNWTTGEQAKYRPNFTMPEDPIPEATRNPKNMQVARYVQPAATTPVSAAADVTDVTAKGSRLSRISERTGNLLGRAVSSPTGKFLGKAAGVAGVVGNFNDYKLDDPEVDSSFTGNLRDIRNGDFAAAGRGFSKGALEAGMDVGSFIANTADLFVPGQGPSRAYNKMLRDKFGDQLIDRSGNNPDAPNTAAIATKKGDGVGPPQPTLEQENEAKLAAFAAAEKAAAGSPKLNDIRNVDNEAGTQEVFSEGRWKRVSTPAAKQAAALREAEYEAKYARDAEAAINGPTSARAQLRNLQNMNADTLESQMMRGEITDPRARRAIEANAGRRAQLRDREMQSEAMMRQAEIQAGGTREAARIKAVADAKNAQLEQFNKDRQYQLDVARFGEDKAKTLFAQRDQADKSLTTKLETLNTFTDPTTKKPVVNNEAVAEHKAAVMAHLQTLADKARARGDAKTADALLAEGPSALDDAVIHKIGLQLQVKRKAAEADGIMPWTGDFKDSPDPGAYNIKDIKPGWLQDKYILNNGSTIPVNDLRYTDGAWYKPNAAATPTDRFNALKSAKALREE